MKKTIPLLLAAILTFSLTACEETPIESSKITSQVTQEPQNGKDTLQNSDESESIISQSISSSVDEQDDRLFLSIIYDEYNMFERESDEMYFTPASDDYILVVQEWNETQVVRLVAFDKKGSVIQYEIRDIRSNWDSLANLDEVLVNNSGKLIDDSMYYHGVYYDDGETAWGQKWDIMLSLKINSLGGTAIDSCNRYHIYTSSPITAEQMLGEYANTLAESDFEILSYHTPISEDYVIAKSKSEVIDVEACETIIGGYTLHINDAFSYYPETLWSFDEDGNCIQYEMIYVFDSPYDAEQFKLATWGYVQKEPRLEVKCKEPYGMELRGNVWLYTFYSDDDGNQIDPCSEELNKAKWWRKAETEYWSKPYLTETQQNWALENQ